MEINEENLDLFSAKIVKNQLHRDNLKFSHKQDQFKKVAPHIL